MFSTSARRIRARSAAKAEAAMRDHLREINRDLPEIVAAMPDFFEEAGGAR